MFTIDESMPEVGKPSIELAKLQFQLFGQEAINASEKYRVVEDEHYGQIGDKFQLNDEVMGTKVEGGYA